ncbi:MAG: cation diffusion facilitator family transporter [Phycisphaerales bacterium]|jgi:cation diffusion facilitator family transporter
MAVVCKRCYWCAKHVGGINLWGNIGLLVVKLTGGILGRSQALIADAIHSLSDVVVSVLLIISLKVSAAPPDEDHPWGHGNVEFIVSAIFGTLLVCAALAITVVSIASIVRGNVYDTGILAVWAAVISVAANEIMFRHSMCVGRQMDSPAMIANAWENRADVWSSLAALAGVFGARIGFPVLDAIAAVIVGFMIAKNGMKTLILGIKGMTDRSFDKAMLAQVKIMVLKEDGIRDVSRLRARQVGQKNWIDVEAMFDPQMKVSEVKQIIERVKKNVMDNFERIGDVVIVSRVPEPQLKEI